MNQIASRKWQIAALKDYFAINPRPHYTLEATPGSGKTRFALAAGQRLLDEKEIDWVIIVCPTVEIKDGWNRAIKSHTRMRFNARVVTYQAIGNGTNSLSQDLRELCATNRVLVIFDEIHHAAKENCWGNGIQLTFCTPRKTANRIICLTGTCFRSDSNRISFVTYKDGESVPDFKYTYLQALNDGVCRPVSFPHYDGLMEWISEGEPDHATLSGKKSRSKTLNCYRTAFTTTLPYLPGLIQQANEKLVHLRGRDPIAGALITCASQTHARNTAELVRDITGVNPALIISDNPKSANMIKEFRDSHDPWMVAVNMISEGVDIPRLRVGVYASTIINSELFFRQFVGRLLRTPEGTLPHLPLDLSAYLFMAALPELIGYATNIEADVSHFLDSLPKGSSGNHSGNGNGAVPPLNRQANSFSPVDATMPDFKGTIHRNGIHTPEDLLLAKRVQEEFNYPSLAGMPDEERIRIAKDVLKARTLSEGKR